MGTIIYHCGLDTVSVEPTFNGEWLRAHDTVNIQRADVASLATALDAAMWGAMARYDGTLAQHARAGTPKRRCTFSIWILSHAPPTPLTPAPSEWQPHVDAAWDRVLRRRARNCLPETWKGIERSVSTHSAVRGEACIFEFVLTNQLKDQ